ncbi:unnamed protein product [Rotaria sordida]|uniref:Uncharacterized protein n=1 Tax=Rotaria sordida TaxID=392033 RepID=A0A814TF27_9BILA|nr:unnamed protein product [Rotaria sordida]CAF1404431.1 unnamed protein product [Rotaria sordida]
MTGIVHSINRFLFRIHDALEQQINQRVIYNETPILLLEDWFILMWFRLFLYSYCDFLLFVLIIYEIITYRNRSTVLTHESELEFSNLLNDREILLDLFLEYLFIYFVITVYVQSNRNAQIEGRTAHPTDETFKFSTTVIDADDEPLAIENTLSHDEGVLIGLNNNRHTYSIINNENGDANEDASLYTAMNDNIITQNLQIGENAQVLNSNGVPELVLDDPTYNINPLNSVEPNDHIQSSNSTEKEQILSSGSSFDDDNEYVLINNDEYDLARDNEYVLVNNVEYNLTNDNEYILIDINDQRDQTLSNTKNLNNHLENDNQLDQTNPTNEQHTRISNTVLSHSEAVENQENVSAPFENAQRTIEGATCLTLILHQKQTDPNNLNIKSIDS